MDTTATGDAFDLRHAATDHVTTATVPARRLFAINGFGPPRSSDFAMATSTLARAEATLSRVLRHRGEGTVGRPVIEVLWTPPPDVSLPELVERFADRDGWRWEQVAGIPARASAEDVATAVDTVRREAGRDQPLLHVLLLAEGPVLQLLQLGGPGSEAETLGRLLAAVDEARLSSHGPIHQLFLSGADTIGGDRQRSILRVAVGPEGPTGRG
jgi:hypothetical protein